MKQDEMNPEEKLRKDIGAFIGGEINKMAASLAKQDSGQAFEEMRQSTITDLMKNAKNEILQRPGSWEKVIEGSMQVHGIYIAALEELLDEYDAIIMNRGSRIALEKLHRRMGAIGFGDG